MSAAVQQDVLDGRVAETNVIVTGEIVVLNVNGDLLLEVRDQEVVRLVPDWLVIILLHRCAPFFLSADVDLDVAVGNILDDFGEEPGDAALLLWRADASSFPDGQADDAVVGLVGLEVVVVGVELDEEAIGKHGHA